jgi:transcriptional regulator with XRE-family HTH domain
MGAQVEKHILRYRSALNYLIKKYKIRQASLAEKVGVSQAQINRILNHPLQAGSENVRRRIARALNSSYEEMQELGRQIMERADPGRPLSCPAWGLEAAPKTTSNQAID